LALSNDPNGAGGSFLVNVSFGSPETFLIGSLANTQTAAKLISFSVSNDNSFFQLIVISILMLLHISIAGLWQFVSFRNTQF
jgi:hypothetical protein